MINSLSYSLISKKKRYICDL